MHTLDVCVHMGLYESLSVHAASWIFVCVCACVHDVMFMSVYAHVCKAQGLETQDSRVLQDQACRAHMMHAHIVFSRTCPSSNHLSEPS